MTAWDREEEQIDKDFESGLISQQEYNKLIQDLHRDRRAAAQEAAQDAYEREMGNW